MTNQEKLEKINRVISSSATPKELIPGLQKKKADLEVVIAVEEVEYAQKVEYRARGKAALKKARADKEAADLALKKARIRRDMHTGKLVKRKAKGQIKAHGKSIKSVRVPKAAKRGKKRAKTFVVPKYVKRFNTGRGNADLKRDMQRHAMPPGKHKQKRGSKHKFYYEKRANRTDVSPKWKLNKGGYSEGGSMKQANDEISLDSIKIASNEKFNGNRPFELIKKTFTNRYDLTRKEVIELSNYLNKLTEYALLKNDIDLYTSVNAIYLSLYEDPKFEKGGLLYDNGGKLRHVKVTYDNGQVINTDMAAHLTDAEIRDYFKVGKEFNVGSGGEDKMAKVKSVEILKNKGGSLYAEGGKPSFKKKDNYCGCEMKKGGYVVTAFKRNEGYKGRRVTITVPTTKEKAEANAEKLKADMAIAIDKYKVFSDIRVEKSPYPIGTKYAKGGITYRKGGKPHPEKVGKVMREFKAHKLKSHGKVVTDRSQAVAIALSEAGLSKPK